MIYKMRWQEYRKEGNTDIKHEYTGYFLFGRLPLYVDRMTYYR
jgi:hypothetical protein